MKDSELQFDRTCHTLYSKACKNQIQAKIALHYPVNECEAVWDRVQKIYIAFISDLRCDLGGKKNFHNGAGGTYDCIALMSYYTVCKEKMNLCEIEKMESALFLPAFRILAKLVNCNKPFFRKLMYKSFKKAEKQCCKWHDYEMRVAPYAKDKPIYYEFTACPVAQFAEQHGLLEAMPAFCNPDYTAKTSTRNTAIRRVIEEINDVQRLKELCYEI